ncbi:proline iminopeptidase [Psychrobacillus psychrotolerans]|uniref:Proline iminopeptidase n=1 Tax=Psychrobacillus psychrotolerans TaxID=126156 RepID=A0A1I6B544_9BACI|nr:alpha/beta hydrolase [Psychrobacillus psychrotolerans]SFQ76035.1 proline iminopeptidase [Psychrobacillus psychrotolerans]
MSEWKKELIETNRGRFEVFVKGEGEPVCITHHYSEFNESGDYFAETFIENNKVFLVNLKDAGNSDKAGNAHELSMVDAVLDLEEIRKVYGYLSWTFAGHSTGGMIGVLYGIHFSSSLKSLIIVGSSAREYSSTSSRCIYNEGHPKFKRMQELMELLKPQSLTGDERNRLSKERTQLSLFEPENFEQYFSKNISKKLSANRLNFFSREQLIFDVTRQLSAVRAKTIILCGRHDVQCPVDFSIEMSELIPNASLHIFEQSNHYPFLEEEFEFKEVLKSVI